MSTDVLLVDPHPDDAEQITDLFVKTAHSNTVHTVHSGEDALDFIHQRGEYSDAPSPQLVLLNPHLPEMDGYDLLDNLKNEPAFKLTPVIILSDPGKEDIMNSYSLRANAVIVKPDDKDEFQRVVDAIETFWLDTAHLPPSSK